MTICSAPGKICLFGEHGIVYGTQSIACAIDLRTYITLKEIYKKKSYIIINNQKQEIEKNEYIKYALNEMKNILDLKEYSIEIKSEIPISSGLGSSSALVIALLNCFNEQYKCNLSLDEISSMGYNIEKKVQGIASPMDTYISTFGGIIKFPTKKRINSFNWDIIICNSNTKSSTKEMVKKVNLLYNKYPKIIKSIMYTINLIVSKAENSINNNNIFEFGNLMNINQGMLDSIGINSKELSILTYSLRKYGSLGSKITGAGGGGAVIGISNNINTSKNILKSLTDMKYNPFISHISNIGVQYEK